MLLTGGGRARWRPRGARASPKLHVYKLEAGAGPDATTAEPALLLDAKDQAVKDTVLPLIAGEERGMLHFFVDRKLKDRAALRITGRNSVALKQLERGHRPLLVAVDAAAGALSVLRVGAPALLWRFGLDGSLREGPTELDLSKGTPPPFVEQVHGEVASGAGETMVFRRSLHGELGVGESLVLARPKRVGTRLSTMQSVMWTGERYVALYGELEGTGSWRVKAQAITCPGG